jgi:uncharacterized membrane protein YqjE
MADIRETDDMRDRPTAELMKQLANETTTLVRQELELAKAEMVQKARPAGIGAGMFGAAAAAALLGLGALTAFLILALDGALPSWLAALIVALLWGAVAGVLAFLGRERVREAGPPKPEQTVESVREDVEVAKASARSGRR